LIKSCNGDDTQCINGKNVPVCEVKPEDKTATLPIAAQAANADEGSFLSIEAMLRLQLEAGGLCVVIRVDDDLFFPAPPKGATD